jgi:hypothetical protein
MPCAICNIRRPKRFCPGVGGDICTICCGTEREVTVSCPLDCPYLQEARRHEKPTRHDESKLLDQDIRVTEQFLRKNEEALAIMGTVLARSALETPGAVDSDMRDTLQALVRTYRTLQSGVYYETRPDNSLANAIFGKVQQGIAEFRKREHEDAGLPITRDADILGLLVFLERLERDQNNARPRGRAFIDCLRGFYNPAADPAETSDSPLIIP